MFSRMFLVPAFFMYLAITTIEAHADNIPYKRSVKLEVGQSVVLKGVRSRDCGKIPEPWVPIRDLLPKSKLGSFSDGGVGTVKSRHCGKIVAARGIKFTAKTPGKERLIIFKDSVRITVK